MGSDSLYNTKIKVPKGLLKSILIPGTAFYTGLQTEQRNIEKYERGCCREGGSVRNEGVSTGWEGLGLMESVA